MPASVVMASAMLTLTSTGAVIDSLAGAENVAVVAYTLSGSVLRALEDAAARGAHVAVCLEGHPYDDARSHLGRLNSRIVAELRRAGADARLADPIHAKTMSVDGTLYLDEKNWRAGDLVLREDDPTEAAAIQTHKGEALEQEANLLAGARAADGVIVESESFGGGNAAYFALRALGRAGAAPRLLVNSRDLRGAAHERTILEDLARDGVRVRVCDDSSKFAVAGDRAWLGSANATYASGKWDMPDWGLCTGNAQIVDAVRTRLESEWSDAREFKA
jgi:phosphatidylserine/phosphatidylglycerophosphate/cardiolipin synthase-like enzyme